MREGAACHGIIDGDYYRDRSRSYSGTRDNNMAAAMAGGDWRSMGGVAMRWRCARSAKSLPRVDLPPNHCHVAVRRVQSPAKYFLKSNFALMRNDNDVQA